MTNERYTFVSDLRDKKAAARGAYAKKGGSKSKRCSLPSDHLTQAELKRRNSPVESIKLNTPITYAELKKLNPNLQYLYLEHCVTTHKGRRKDIVDMLGINQATFARLLPTLPGCLEFKGRPKTVAPEWTAFIGGTETTDPIPEPEPEAEPKEEKKEIVLEPPVLSGSITMVATLPDLGAQLLKLISGDTAYQFTVSFSRV